MFRIISLIQQSAVSFVCVLEKAQRMLCDATHIVQIIAVSRYESGNELLDSTPMMAKEFQIKFKIYF